MVLHDSQASCYHDATDLKAPDLADLSHQLSVIGIHTTQVFGLLVDVSIRLNPCIGDAEVVQHDCGSRSP